MNYLEKSLKTQASNEGFGSILASFSNSGHCLSCGNSFHVFNKEIKCCVCGRNFCNLCVTRITDESLLQAMDVEPSGAVFSCEICRHALRMRESVEFRRKFRILKSSSYISELYSSVSEVRNQISAFMPPYEYLASSIIEIKSTKSELKSDDKRKNEDQSFGASYTQVKVQEKKLMALLKDFQESNKKIVEFKPSESPTENTLVNNIKIAHTDYLQNVLIKFKDIQKRVARLELNAVAKIYMFLRQIDHETQYHSEFTRWHKHFKDCYEAVLNEVSQICTSQLEENWEPIGNKIQGRIKKKIDTIDKLPANALIQPKDKTAVEKKTLKEVISSISEPLMMRKVTELVKNQHDRFIDRRFQCPVAAKALAFLRAKLEKGFDDGLKFS
eukprot:TRINITY_DN7052_c0_g1_i3.p1 TRINITY_DN7052_c0_g1~~TRINITY_DN7052_c0_g1_i3.p1  ORF type:complete len:386 (-),score=53.35 TRINITY_DN7052_c0_g1_i3:40-1197(-)